MTVINARIAPDHFRQHPAAPRVLHAVPDRIEARGFALYVGVDENQVARAGLSLKELAEILRRTAAELVPDVQTHATAAVVPRGAGGRDIDIVRLVLHDPDAIQRRTRAQAPAKVVVDLSRRHVTIGGRRINLTDKEFRLLTHLIEKEGETIPRDELLDVLWTDEQDPRPSPRTIDVHIRRLRAKLGEFEDIVRTVRGVGYRFDRHADVQVKAA